MKIFESNYLKAMSVYDDKNIIWLSKDGMKHRQLWAIGSNKTEVRISIDTLYFSNFKLPTELDQRRELFRLGADKWCLGEREVPIGRVFKNIKVFNSKLGKYVKSSEIDYTELDCRRWKFRDTYWYKRRWNYYYDEKFGEIGQ